MGPRDLSVRYRGFGDDGRAAKGEIRVRRRSVVSSLEVMGNETFYCVRVVDLVANSVLETQNFVGTTSFDNGGMKEASVSISMVNPVDSRFKSSVMTLYIKKST